MHPETFRTERAILNAPLQTKNSGGCWNVVVRMICINNKYGFIELTNIYRINQNLSNFSTKKSHVTGSILNWGSSVAEIAHSDARCIINILCKNLK